MDAVYVATPMEAKTFMVTASVVAVEKVFTLTTKAHSLVATYARSLSRGGVSLSAVSPDFSTRKDTALAAA
jgi:arginase family enzyme